MSVQEPRDQFERESVEDEIEELQDSLDESSLSDSETASDPDSVDVPADETTSSSSDDSDGVEEADEVDVPPVESMPLSASDELPPPGPQKSQPGT